MPAHPDSSSTLHGSSAIFFGCYSLLKLTGRAGVCLVDAGRFICSVIFAKDGSAFL